MAMVGIAPDAGAVGGQQQQTPMFMKLGPDALDIFNWSNALMPLGDTIDGGAEVDSSWTATASVYGHGGVSPEWMAALFSNLPVNLDAPMTDDSVNSAFIANPGKANHGS